MPSFYRHKNQMVVFEPSQLEDLLLQTERRYRNNEFAYHPLGLNRNQLLGVRPPSLGPLREPWL